MNSPDSSFGVPSPATSQRLAFVTLASPFDELKAMLPICARRFAQIRGACGCKSILTVTIDLNRTSPVHVLAEEEGFVLAGFR
jgi:hypothetical protein